MTLSKQSTVAELRHKIDRKRIRALELQMDTRDANEWDSLNAVRWELQDLDTDLYQSQYIKNNEKIEKLIGKIQESSEDARQIIETLDRIKKVIKKARKKLKKNSPRFKELSQFLNETKSLTKVFQE